MLEALETLAQRLDSLPLATRQELVAQVRHFQGFLLDFNRAYLAKEGLRPDGAVIGDGSYSPAYAAYKAKYGKFKNTAFKDLKLTGDYADAFVLDYLGAGVFEVTNTDPKAAVLAKQYGPLLGIREADLLAFMADVIEPEIKAFVGHYMQL